MPTASPKMMLIAIVSIGLGIWTAITNYEVSKELYPPIVEACFAASKYETMKEFQAHTGLQPYNRYLGLRVFDPLVCFSTQFLYDLRTQQYPAGLLLWGTAVLIGCPAFITMYLEAGKQQSKASSILNPLIWPTILWILFLVLGVSVIWPLIWIPSYCLWGNTASNDNNTITAISPFRTKMVLLVSLAMPIFTTLVFCVFDVKTSAWTICAGILGGPLVCTPGILLTILDSKTTTSNNKDSSNSTIQSSNAEIIAMVYAISGIVSLLGYFYLIYTTLTYYGIEFLISRKEIFKEFWFGDDSPESETEDGHIPHPSIQFMFVDAIVFWIGYLLYIATLDIRRMLEAAILTPLFGPGASCAMAMASIEMDRAIQIAPPPPAAPQSQTTTTTTTSNKKEN